MTVIPHCLNLHIQVGEMEVGEEVAEEEEAGEGCPRWWSCCRRPQRRRRRRRSLQAMRLDCRQCLVRVIACLRGTVVVHVQYDACTLYISLSMGNQSVFCTVGGRERFAVDRLHCWFFFGIGSFRLH